MAQYCSVFNCSSVRRNNTNLSFHLFPKENQKIRFVDDFGNSELVDRRKLWAIKLGMRKKISNCMVVCSRHFTEYDYECSGWSGQKRLKPTTIPSQNLPSSNTDTRLIKLKQKQKLANARTSLQKKRETVSKSPSNTVVKEIAIEDSAVEGLSMLGSCSNIYDSNTASKTVSVETDSAVEYRDCAVQVNYEEHNKNNNQTILSNENIKNESQNYPKNVDHLFSCEKCTPEDYLCPHCDFKTDLIQALKIHKLNHHGNKETSEDYNINLYTCEKCHFRTFSILLIIGHFSGGCVETTETPQPTSKSRPTKWHNCDRCPYRTKVSYNLTRHRIYRHTKEEDVIWHTCDLCPFKAKTKGTLTEHVLIRHTSGPEAKWFECDQCPYRNKLGKVLKRHVKQKHTEQGAVRWFSCEHCEYRGKTRCHLKQHVIVKHVADEDLKWYQCDFCEYRFKLKGNLKRHVLIHFKNNV